MARWLRRANEHERVEVLLSTYLDGRASHAERALVEHHLKSCADCARNLATLRATVAAVRTMPHVRAPRSFALPRSMAKQPRSTPWSYPLLRTATAIATFLFAVVVAGDLYTRFTLFSTSAPMAAPAALPPTVIAMQAAATPVKGPAPQIAAPATSPAFAEQAAPPPAPQAAAPLAPVTTASGARQAAATSAPATAATALDLAAVPATEAPSAAAKAVPPETPVEPPTEQPMGASGLGGGAGGVGQAPSTAAVAPTRLLAGQASEAATAQPTSTPLAAPTEVARIPAPQPLVAPEQRGAYQVQRPSVSPLRIAEGALAIAVVALGMAAWIARRRNR
jgi:anti-sigma factor RsiW